MDIGFSKMCLRFFRRLSFIRQLFVVVCRFLFFSFTYFIFFSSRRLQQLEQLEQLEQQQQQPLNVWKTSWQHVR